MVSVELLFKRLVSGLLRTPLLLTGFCERFMEVHHSILQRTHRSGSLHEGQKQIFNETRLQ
jgi:hypothetical protein